MVLESLTGGDNDVSIDEFILLMVRIRSKATFLRSDDQIVEAFELADQDEDGCIGAEDLAQLFKDIGETVSMEDCESMVYSVCGIFNGKVTLDQFKKFVLEGS